MSASSTPQLLQVTSYKNAKFGCLMHTLYTLDTPTFSTLPYVRKSPSESVHSQYNNNLWLRALHFYSNKASRKMRCTYVNALHHTVSFECVNS